MWLTERLFTALSLSLLVNIGQIITVDHSEESMPFRSVETNRLANTWESISVRVSSTPGWIWAGPIHNNPLLYTLTEKMLSGFIWVHSLPLSGQNILKKGTLSGCSATSQDRKLGGRVHLRMRWHHTVDAYFNGNSQKTLKLLLSQHCNLVFMLFSWWTEQVIYSASSLLIDFVDSTLLPYFHTWKTALKCWYFQRGWEVSEVGIKFHSWDRPSPASNMVSEDVHGNLLAAFWRNSAFKAGTHIFTLFDYSMACIVNWYLIVITALSFIPTGEIGLIEETMLGYLMNMRSSNDEG